MKESFDEMKSKVGFYSKHSSKIDTVLYGVSSFEYKNKYSEEQLFEFLELQRTLYLKTIKNCVVFFTVLVVIGLAIGLAIGLTAASS